MVREGSGEVQGVAFFRERLVKARRDGFRGCLEVFGGVDFGHVGRPHPSRCPMSLEQRAGESRLAAGIHPARVDPAATAKRTPAADTAPIS